MTIKSFISVIVAAALLLAALGAYGLWYAHVSKRSAEAAVLAGQVRTLGEAGGRAAAVRRALESLSRDEAGVYGHFVGNTTVVPYLEEVQATGQGLGAEVEVVSVDTPPAKPGQQGYLQMSLRITGSFEAVVRTLGALEYQPYDTTLSSVTLDTPSEEGAKWTAAAVFLVGMTPGVATTTPKAP